MNQTSSPASKDARAAAALALAAIFRQHAPQSLDDALTTYAHALSDRDRAFAHELCYGVCRQRLQLDALLQQLLSRALPSKSLAVHCLLQTALYQLLTLNTPPHAAVAATVDACRALNAPGLSGMVNAVLRRFLREREALLPAINTVDSYPLNSHPLNSHPQWLLKRLQQSWPQHWQTIVAANDQHAPLTLRVNRLRTTREALQQQWQEHDISSTATAFSADGLQLATPVAITSLPGFHEGLFSVQDEAAQLAAPLLAPSAGSTVLDACAAPGGKTAHLQEHSNNTLAILAIDNNAKRCQRIHDTLQRLQLDAEVITADASKPERWSQQRQWQHILLDAPCSATGVIRRHPDIRWLRRDSDISQLTQTQGKLLQALWPRLQQGGTLLYCTCSLLAEENEQQIAAFLSTHADAEEIAISAEWGMARTHGRQILPGDHDMDGFYYCLLRKQ